MENMQVENKSNFPVLHFVYQLTENKIYLVYIDIFLLLKHPRS